MIEQTAGSESSMIPSDLAETARRTSSALRALSHEHRLMILGILARGERSVGELETLLHLPQPAVSQQLARLRLDNLVNCRRDGRTIYYSLATERIATICAAMTELLTIAAENAPAAGVETVGEAAHAIKRFAAVS